MPDFIFGRDNEALTYKPSLERLNNIKGSGWRIEAFGQR